MKGQLPRLASPKPLSSLLFARVGPAEVSSTKRSVQGVRCRRRNARSHFAEQISHALSCVMNHLSVWSSLVDPFSGFVQRGSAGARTAFFHARELSQRAVFH